MSVEWFRSWHGAPTDPKWRVIAKRASARAHEVSAVAWALLDYASQADDRGSVLGFDFETYAEQVDMDEAMVRAIYAAMEAKEIIVNGRLATWEKRQPKREDSSSERTVKSRRKSDAQPVLPLTMAEMEDAVYGSHISSDESMPAPLPAKESHSAPEPGPEPTPDDTPPQPIISPQAIHLADEVAILAGHDLKFVPPNWCGAAARAQVWISRGWSTHLILESVKAQIARKRDGPPDSIRYFEKGIARAHAAIVHPLPIVQPAPQETIHAQAIRSDTGGGFHRLSRTLAERRGPPPHDGAPGHLRVIDGSGDS